MTTAMNEAEKLADKLDSSDANFYGESSLWFDSDLSDAVSDAADLLRRQAEQIKLLGEALEGMLAGTDQDCGRIQMPSNNAVRGAFGALAATRRKHDTPHTSRICHKLR